MHARVRPVQPAEMPLIHNQIVKELQGPPVLTRARLAVGSTGDALSTATGKARPSSIRTRRPPRRHMTNPEYTGPPQGCQRAKARSAQNNFPRVGPPEKTGGTKTAASELYRPPTAVQPSQRARKANRRRTGRFLLTLYARSRRAVRVKTRRSAGRSGGGFRRTARRTWRFPAPPGD
jgi:hypothetical protein